MAAGAGFLLGALLTACGGSSAAGERTVTVAETIGATVTVTPSAEATVEVIPETDATAETETEEDSGTTDASGVPDCGTAGISIEGGKTGTCIDDGTTYVVVNKDGTARLDELDARLVSVETARRVESPNYDPVDFPDGRVQALGTFVLVTVEITNRASTPQQVYVGQVVLGIGDNTYTEDFNAENGPVEDSWVWNSEVIQPDQARQGVVVFDLPDSAYAKLTAPGSGVFVANFSHQLADEAPTQVGDIRLWK